MCFSLSRYAGVMGACAIHGTTREGDGDETDIPQIAAGFSVILLPFRSPSVCVFSIGAVSMFFLTSICSATERTQVVPCICGSAGWDDLIR
jgi:hypothetical protein